MKLKLLFALLIFQMGFAQQRTCDRQEILEQMENNPVAKQAYLETQNKLRSELKRLETNKGEITTVIIPVAVHFPLVSNANSIEAKNCLIDLAKSQINVLNADYSATNADLSNWTSEAINFPMVSQVGNFKMQFVLATQNHPTGSGIADGTVAVTFGTAFLNAPNSDIKWAGYLNIVVRELPGNYVGLSPNLGASPAKGDCIFIAPYAFGANQPGCGNYGQGGTYLLGRTTTHELGHYFQLEHPFNQGCAATADCKTMGDYVCDTPAISTESRADALGNCPSLVPACVSGEYALSMNFMDYAPDKCAYMFTKGQEDRARAWYNLIAAEFKTNVLSSNTYLKSKFSMYPNPSKGSFTIQFEDFTSNFAVEVFDTTGKVIYENKYNQNSGLQHIVNLENVTQGIYFVNIKSDQGMATKKIVIQ